MGEILLAYLPGLAFRGDTILMIQNTGVGHLLPEQVRDRFLGATLGLAVGDALGSQFEARTATEIRLSLANRPFRMEGSRRYRLRPGEWTDDTAQFLTTMNSFVNNQGFEGLDVAGALCEWLRTNPRGVGMHTRDILRDLTDDIELWENLGRRVWLDSAGMKAGNGALCRCLVAGLYYWNDLEKMVDATIGLSQITHFDPRAIEGALVVNFLLIQCLHNRYSYNLLDQCLAFLESVRQTKSFNENVHRYNLAELNENTNFSPYPTYHQEHNAIVDGLKHIHSMKIEDLHTTGYVVNTVQLAVWSLFHNETFEDAMETAVCLGGDADTQGAVVGALCGARFGLSQIPNEWYGPIKDRSKLVTESELLLERSTTSDEKSFRAGERKPSALPPSIL